MATTPKYDLYSDRFRSHTYDTFAQMRAEDPVFCQPGIDGETMIWFLTRHDDVVTVLLDDDRFVRDPALALGCRDLPGRGNPRWRAQGRQCRGHSLGRPADRRGMV